MRQEYRLAVARMLDFFVRRVTVDGTSMSPTYLSGERVTGCVGGVTSARATSWCFATRGIARAGSSSAA